MTLDYFYGQAGKLFSFYRIPKALFQEPRFQSLSTDAKILYGILLDRMSLSVKNEWFDKQGRVFIIFTIEDVKRALCCADNKATKLLRELEKFGLIERKRRGQGKPCLVYVKNFSAESSKESVKNRDNDDSCGSKIACQDPVKSRGIKKKENKTEMNNTNPILSDESEKMKNRELLEEYFSYSLEIDLLLRLCPDDEDTLYQIVDLLVDTCATNRKMLHIAGDDKPAEVVRSRFMKLNADHIRFVLKCLAENSSPIRNMKQYLLASLYNAPTTMRDLNLLNQAWPNAVFGLRPRLFFLLIPYIHIFVLHRRFYERERPYHLRASDLRGNGTDPGDDPVHPHALRCLPLQFCRIQGVQNRHCSQRRPKHGHLHSLPDPARS